MYVCMYVCMYVYIYIYIYIYEVCLLALGAAPRAHVGPCMYVYIYIYMYIVHTYIYTHICMCVYI